MFPRQIPSRTGLSSNPWDRERDRPSVCHRRALYSSTREHKILATFPHRGRWSIVTSKPALSRSTELTAGFDEGTRDLPNEIVELMRVAHQSQCSDTGSPPVLLVEYCATSKTRCLPMRSNVTKRGEPREVTLIYDRRIFNMFKFRDKNVPTIRHKYHHQ